jgi:hypothetical protein
LRQRRTSKPTISVSCRVTADVFDRIEHLLPKLEADERFTGVLVSRARVLTLLLVRGLAALEHELESDDGDESPDI